MNAIFLAVKHYFFLQNVCKCCQKIVIYLFHLFTPSNLGIACQRHARVGLRPKYPPIIARFPPVKNFSYISGTVYCNIYQIAYGHYQVTDLITSENPRVKRDGFYILSGLSISQGIIHTLCSVACIKTINIIFRSQVFEVDQKADPQEEINITEGKFNSKK